MPTLQRFGAVSVRIYADDHRPPLEPRIVPLLDGREERVHVSG